MPRHGARRLYDRAALRRSRVEHAAAGRGHGADSRRQDGPATVVKVASGILCGVMHLRSLPPTRMGSWPPADPTGVTDGEWLPWRKA